MVSNNSISSTGVTSILGSETEREELPQKDRKWYRNPLVQVITGLVVLVIVLISILSGLLITRQSDAPRAGELRAGERKSDPVTQGPGNSETVTQFLGTGTSGAPETVTHRPTTGIGTSLGSGTTTSGKPEPVTNDPGITITTTTTTTQLPTTPKAPDPPAARKICNTPACITLAHELHNFADPSVDPCVDFYKATCGKYAEHTLARGNMFNKKEIINKRLVKDFIRGNSSTTSLSGRTMRLLYRKCESMKNAQRFADESSRIIKEIAENIDKIGKFPLTIQGSFTIQRTYITDMLVNIAKLSVPSFGWLRFVGERMRPTLYPMPFSINNVYKLKDKIIRILKAKNIQIDENSIVADINAVVHLTQKIAPLAKADGSRVKYEKVKESMDFVDLDRVLQAIADPKRFEWAKVVARIWVFNAEIFNEDTLKNIIKSAPPRTIIHMLIFQYIDHFGDQFFDEKTARDRDCSKFVMDTLPQSALYVYIQRHFNSNNAKSVFDMTSHLRDAYLEMFQKSTMFKDQTKQTVYQKLRKMSKVIGVPENWEQQLEANHKSVNLQPTDSFLTMTAKIIKFKQENSISNVVNGVLFKTEADPFMGNAYFDPYDNYVRIFHAMLSSPMFDVSFPNYAKFGGIGTITGHEMGHGFGLPHVEFDEDGDYNPKKWDEGDLGRYKQRTRCFVDLYTNHDDPTYGRKFNGSITFNEQISDDLGYRSAWSAHKKLARPTDSDLVGFEGRSHDEMFFRVAALHWCSPKDTIPLKHALSSSHPLHNFRVNGVVPNLKAFAETFNCPLGSPMNPRKKCELL